ncbi:MULTISPECIES: aminotransferase class III-fold pyridoxal phosphate-dependent enzyme [unclassified Variovorax]|uniref:aspartate aminotransferase family protein n=1 Tax=unclassified Variovorax TaxID=663243 RepID=UPI00076C55B3|nr:MULTISPECIES: aminotransferase class III-fold pyridoxal phosphate-dependent enzyme [unclassified Variovorax]KWT73879.1 Glutamate-1-semialdehyde aminotransferase [Variovorax sp. WDL1]
MLIIPSMSSINVGCENYLQQIRFVCSGTEAVMSAVRLARAYTGRTKILRFLGGYHGHFDLVQNKDEAVLRDAGLDPAAMRSNILVPYNDAAMVERAFAEARGEIAAIVLEPVACNMSLVLPQDGFLQDLRRICDREGALLVFDEVISGFRFNYGPVSNLLGVEPDIATFGKVIGGGTPIGAFGGRREIMALLDTEQMLQGGTFAGNPLTMAAGLATLAELAKPETYAELERKGALLESAIDRHRAANALDFTFARMGQRVRVPFLAEGHLGALARRCTAPAARELHRFLSGDADAGLPPDAGRGGDHVCIYGKPGRNTRTLRSRRVRSNRGSRRNALITPEVLVLVQARRSAERC